ncbi:MAG: DUF3883 domain-containing protein [Firmicutes bacterium]|nr:DUF3883 domain-containing protein [Bacillota bacterium]
MQEELKRCNSIGNIDGVLYFSKVLFASIPTNIDNMKKSCSFVPAIELNCTAAICFFDFIGIIKIENKSIKITDLGEGACNLDNERLLDFFARCCLDTLIKREIIKHSSIRYNYHEHRIEISTSAFPLNFASFRNFLITLKVLVAKTDVILELDEAYENFFSDSLKNNEKSLEHLLKQLESQRERGATAEAFVMRYEKQRLSNSLEPKLISSIDVSAGYDIVSFNSLSSTSYDRFIEVKSFQYNVRFFWSVNEMEVAKVLEEKYFLYLIDMRKIHENGYSPMIIQNPYVNLTREYWILEPNSYLITKV